MNDIVFFTKLFNHMFYFYLQYFYVSTNVLLVSYEMVRAFVFLFDLDFPIP